MSWGVSCHNRLLACFCLTSVVNKIDTPLSSCDEHIGLSTKGPKCTLAASGGTPGELFEAFDAGRGFPQRRRLAKVFGAVRVAAEVLDQPVVDMVRDVHLGVLVEECGVSDGVKSFTEVQGNDNDKMVGGEKAGDGM